MGEIRSRTNEDIEAEGLDKTMQNTLIEVWGDKDGVGQKVTL